MRRYLFVALLLYLLSPAVTACTLTASQRQYLMYQAVLLLDPSVGSSGGGTNAGSNKGRFTVKAEHYYRGNRYIQVKKIHVHEYSTWANETNEWNSGRVDEFELRLNNAEVGKYYQVRVEWEDGKTYTSEYQMEQGGKTVRISEPL